jgi:coenzyme F420 hydrogenase subunit beta
LKRVYIPSQARYNTTTPSPNYAIIAITNQMTKLTANTSTELINKVVKAGTCTGCGLCVGIDSSGKSKMIHTSKGPRPQLSDASIIPDEIFNACAGYQLDYPQLYRDFYGAYPENWLVGKFQSAYVGFSGNDQIRRNSSSGGIITSVLCYLLESKRIDAAIVVKQGVPSPEVPGVIIARTAREITDASQSIYVPVSTLDILNQLKEGEKYAITLLPEQSAALRILQTKDTGMSRQIKYVLGPYTGTSIKPKAIEVFKRINGVKKNDKTTSLKWRAGEWPGYLEIKTESGKVLKSPKVYYNFLIPFFVADMSLQSMDFANEFADLAVGDAWSPQYESIGQGFSLVVSRSDEMDTILQEMSDLGKISLEVQPREMAGEMHGHMIDFKKRGSYIRNRMRQKLGFYAPLYGYKPKNISTGRILTEIVISGIFMLGRTAFARLILYLLPESFIGPVFNRTRLAWKKISRPTKREGLKDFEVEIKPIS